VRHPSHHGCFFASDGRRVTAQSSVSCPFPLGFVLAKGLCQANIADFRMAYMLGSLSIFLVFLILLFVRRYWKARGEPSSARSHVFSRNIAKILRSAWALQRYARWIMGCLYADARMGGQPRYTGARAKPAAAWVRSRLASAQPWADQSWQAVVRWTQTCSFCRLYLCLHDIGAPVRDDARSAPLLSALAFVLSFLHRVQSRPCCRATSL